MLFPSRADYRDPDPSDKCYSSLQLIYKSLTVEMWSCSQELRLQVRARALHERLQETGEEEDRDGVRISFLGTVSPDDSGVPDRVQDILPHGVQVRE